MPNWRWVASAIATLVVLPVVGQFFIELATELGLYIDPLKRLWGLLDAITSSPAFPWIAGSLLGFACGTWIENAARQLKKSEEPAALARIEFDPANKEGRYWSTATWPRGDGTLTGIEYRVAVENLTPQTLRAVVIKVEILIDREWRPGTGEFIGSGKPQIDLHPLSREFARILLHAAAPGIGDGEVLVTVSGETLPPVSQRFSVKQGRMPLVEAI